MEALDLAVGRQKSQRRQMREVERDLLGKREDAARVLKELKRSNMKTRTQRRRWDGEGGGRNGEGGGRNREGGGRNGEGGGRNREGVGGLEREMGGTEREVGGMEREEQRGRWEELRGR